MLRKNAFLALLFLISTLFNTGCIFSSSQKKNRRNPPVAPQAAPQTVTKTEEHQAVEQAREEAKRQLETIRNEYSEKHASRDKCSLNASLLLQVYDFQSSVLAQERKEAFKEISISKDLRRQEIGLSLAAAFENAEEGLKAEELGKEAEAAGKKADASNYYQEAIQAYQEAPTFLQKVVAAYDKHYPKE
ncbi:MAG: hypothetical protein AAF963_02965 [Bacteroidota bacterium]